MRVQTPSESLPSPPCWLGDVVRIVEHMRMQGIFPATSERVRLPGIALGMMR